MSKTIIAEIKYPFELKTEPMNDPNAPGWDDLEDEEKEAFFVHVYERGYLVATWLYENEWSDCIESAKSAIMDRNGDLIWFSLSDEQRQQVADVCEEHFGYNAREQEGFES